MNRVSVKRLLAVVLAVTMLVALNASPMAVWAAELQKPEMPTASITKINPMYAHLEVPASSGVATASAEDVYVAANAQEAAAILKDLLYSRADAAILQMPVDITYDAADEDAFWEALWVLEEDIYLAAVAHTGDPKEGDYLRYHTYMRDIEAGMWVEDTTMVELCYYFTYNATVEQEKAVDTAVDTLLAGWDLDGADDYEKVCAVYDWLCGNVVYSEDLSPEYGTIYSAYGALVDKDCVCQGYAAALYRLLLELGVDCRVIAGIGNGGPHAWNIIEMEELYYNADATWDATYSQAGLEYQYFLKSEANFPDHYRETEFTTEAFYATYPMGSADYVYTPSTEEPEEPEEDTGLKVGVPVSVPVDPENPWGLLAVTAETTEGYTLSIAEDVDFYSCLLDSNLEWLADGTSWVLEEGKNYFLHYEIYGSELTQLTFQIDVTHDFYNGKCNYCDEVPAVVATGTCGEALSWELDSGGTLRITGTGAMYDYTDNQPAPWLEAYQDAIRHVVIEEGVTRIGNYAFAKLDYLKTCQIPEGVESVGAWAFFQVGMSDVTLPSTLTTLEESSFCNSNLTSVHIPAGLVNLGEDVFSSCYMLASYTVDSENANFSALNGVLFDKAQTTLLAFPVANEMLSYAVPETVATIAAGAFDGTRLKAVEISASVTEIGEYAFSDCSNMEAFTVASGNPNYSSGPNGELMNKNKTLLIRYPGGRVGSYTVPATVTEIADSAFRMSEYLTCVVVPEHVKTIDSLAFQYCMSLVKVEVRNPDCTFGIAVMNATDNASLYGYAGSTAESHAQTEGYTFVSLDGDTALLAGGTFGEGLTWALDQGYVLTVSGEGTMPDYADTATPWSDYKEVIRGVEIADGITYVGAESFKNMNSLCYVTMADSVADAGAYAFAACQRLASAELSDSLTALPEGMFMECMCLLQLDIPDSVTSIGADAVGACYQLELVTIRNAACVIDSNAFRDSHPTICGVEGSTAQTFAQENDLTFTALSVQTPATSGTCGDTATWNFADGVLTISGTGAVTENSWLEDYADSIVSAVIEDGITYLCDSAFDGCGNLTSVSIGNTVETIGYYAFRNCTALENITIPANVLRIGNSAFVGCTALTQVTLEEGVEFIQLYAFSGTGLTSVVIPASVTDLGVEAFGDCAALQSVQFLGTAPEFDIDVFKNVTATVSYPAGATWTEEVLQQYGGTLTWVAVRDLFALAGASVSLGDSLDMYFVVSTENLDAGCYAVCTRSYADGRADHVVTVPYDQWVSLYGDLKAPVYAGIAAKEMGDEITVVIYDAEGNAISEAWTDSVETYSLRMLQDESILADSEAVTVFVDMLNYGAAAQTFFGYDTENLVNAGLTEEQKACATGTYTMENDLVGGPGRAATSLTLKNRITLDLFFNNSVIGSDYSQLYAIATYTDHYGNAVQTRIEGSDFKAYGEECAYVSIPGLSVADYGQAVTCTVYDADGNALAWTTDSIEGYAYRMADQLPAVVEAIVKFGISAYNFFHD